MNQPEIKMQFRATYDAHTDGNATVGLVAIDPTNQAPTADMIEIAGVTYGFVPNGDNGYIIVSMAWAHDPLSSLVHLGTVTSLFGHYTANKLADVIDAKRTGDQFPLELDAHLQGAHTYTIGAAMDVNSVR